MTSRLGTDGRPWSVGALGQVGAPVAALPTPVLLVDEAQLDKNIRRMAGRMDGPVKLRPHFKTHKTIQIATRQMEAGAIGLTTATVWEAQALAMRGVPDILIANQVIDPLKLRVAAETARRCDLTIAVDSEFGVLALESAAVASGAVVNVIIEVDVGMGRSGVRSISEATDVASAVERASSLKFSGVMGYEGHCVIERNRSKRQAMALEAINRLDAVANTLRSIGHQVDIVSAGGTGTAEFTGSDSRITDIQAGSYVFMDTVYEEIVPEFPPALSVLATVVSRSGTTAVLDCGVKTVAPTTGTVGQPRLRSGGGRVLYVAEEHTVVDLPAESAVKVGDRVEVISGHCCETVNLHDKIVVSKDGLIVDSWEILGRGAGWNFVDDPAFVEATPIRPRPHRAGL